MLRRFDRLGAQAVTLFKDRERLARFALVGIVGALLINGGEARKRNRMPGRAEHIAFAQDVGGNGVINRLGHLAGDKARPDQLVKLILVGGKRAFNLVGQQRDVRRADGFMRVLCRALGLEHARLAGVVFLAIASPDKGGNGGRCFISETHRVGTHIGDQTGHTNSLDINALIQLLRDAHRAARARTFSSYRA